MPFDGKVLHFDWHIFDHFYSHCISLTKDNSVYMITGWLKKWDIGHWVRKGASPSTR